MKTQLLLALPDPTYRDELRYVFEADGYGIREAETIKEAAAAVESHDTDIVLSDMQYRDGTGLAMIERLRKSTPAPILIVTDIAEDLNKVLAFEYGADDFLVKPFNILELKARMRAVLRRTRSGELSVSHHEMNVGSLRLNWIGHRATYNETALDFTATEFDVLYILASDPGEIYSRYRLAEAIWSDDYTGDIRTLDVHIKRIRQKFREAGFDRPPIHTKWGEGYYFSEHNEK